MASFAEETGGDQGDELEHQTFCLNQFPAGWQWGARACESGGTDIPPGRCIAQNEAPC